MSDKNSCVFELPEILIAERVGRAMVESRPPVTGEKWLCVAECSAPGAGALAAIRHAANLGADCSVVLLSAQADSNSAFAAMLEVAGCMDLPVMLFNNKSLPGADVYVCGFDACQSVQPETATVLDANDFTAADAWAARLPGACPETLLRELSGETPLFSCEEIRAIDACAIEEYGLPGVCLMENAGIGACAVACAMLGNPETGKALIIAGRGNNGGDAFVVARGLCEQGYAVDLCLLSDPARLRGDTAENFDILDRTGFDFTIIESAAQLADKIKSCNLIIDGMLGTGLKGDVRGIFADCIGTVNASDIPVLALDIPSGLDADSGEPLNCAVNASKTVTFAAVKQGFSSPSGLKHCGEIILGDIGVPAEILEDAD